MGGGDRAARWNGACGPLELIGETALGRDDDDARRGQQQGALARLERTDVEDHDQRPARGRHALGPRVRGARGRVQRLPQLLLVGMRALVQQHDVDDELLGPPVFLGAQHLADGLELGLGGAAHQHDRPVAGNAEAPQRRRAGLVRGDDVAIGAQPGIGVHHGAGECLEQSCLAELDVHVVQAGARIGPGLHRRALEAARQPQPVGEL